MRKKLSVRTLLDPIRDALTNPSALAFVPAACLAAFWLGGEVALASTALGLPLLFALLGMPLGRSVTALNAGTRPCGLVPISTFTDELDFIRTTAKETDEKAACIAISLDNFVDLLDQHGESAANNIALQFGDRVLAMIRGRDLFAQAGKNRFLVGLQPSPRLDLEACIDMSGRIQSAIEEPFSLNGANVYLSCSIGFCTLSNLPEAEAEADHWIEAATVALAEAQRNGPSTIRAYSSDTRRRSLIRANLHREFVAALENGGIRPWFQPQISTNTGEITGFEALARWDHPQKGIMGPQIFLPFAEQAELMERLGQVVRHHAFEAMRNWDQQGFNVPRIGINFSSDELRNPALVDRLKWELDQFDITPDRLAVEILETVFSRRPDDVITRNVTALAALGCCIDLDDFGTGHASIASIKRFAVSRIKIDRTFVAKADRDAGQQQLVGAILTLAERLKVETLAEGVETAGEHALLAQLGADHIQGFGIGKPMPFERTQAWMTSHQSKVKGTPVIGRKLG